MEKKMGKSCSCIEIVQKHPAKLYNYDRVFNKKIITEQFDFSDWNQDSDFHR